MIEPAEVPTKFSTARKSTPAVSSIAAQDAVHPQLSEDAATGEHEHVGAQIGRTGTPVSVANRSAA